MTRKSTVHNDNRWMLQDAKARLSEVVRRAKDVGPQLVTVHGREEAVVVSTDDYRKLKGGGRTGADIVAAFQACPYPDELVIDHEPIYSPVRDVEL